MTARNGRWADQEDSPGWAPQKSPVFSTGSAEFTLEGADETSKPASKEAVKTDASRGDGHHRGPRGEGQGSRGDGQGSFRKGAFGDRRREGAGSGSGFGGPRSGGPGAHGNQSGAPRVAYRAVVFGLSGKTDEKDLEEFFSTKGCRCVSVRFDQGKNAEERAEGSGSGPATKRLFVQLANEASLQTILKLSGQTIKGEQVTIKVDDWVPPVRNFQRDGPRERPEGGFRPRANREHSSESQTDSAKANAEGASTAPAEPRKKIVLAPRTKPIDEIGKVVERSEGHTSEIFGKGVPRSKKEEAAQADEAQAKSTTEGEAEPRSAEKTYSTGEDKSASGPKLFRPRGSENRKSDHSNSSAGQSVRQEEPAKPRYQPAPSAPAPRRNDNRFAKFASSMSDSSPKNDSDNDSELHDEDVQTSKTSATSQKQAPVDDEWKVVSSRK